MWSGGSQGEKPGGWMEAQECAEMFVLQKGGVCTSVRAVCLHVSAHCLHPVANQPVKRIPPLRVRVDYTTHIIARRQFIKNTAYGVSV